MMVMAVPFAGLTIYKNTLGQEPPKPESWLYEKMPVSMEGASLKQSLKSEVVSYEMDEDTYEVLDPIGIACQVWDTPEGEFDAVVIAGTSMKSFP